MFFLKKKEEEKKNKSNLDKVLLWFVIWSAVAWVVWAWLKTEKWQQIKEDVSKKLQETTVKVQELLDERKAKKKSWFWFVLHNIFFWKNTKKK